MCVHVDHQLDQLMVKAFIKSHPNLLFPCFQLQKAIQRKIFG
jgi:hypothetical protein